MIDKKRFVFAERKRALETASICGLSVIEEQQTLTGYQIYIVEQWVCDRKANSNVVKVFTGDASHVIQVAVIAISTAELQHPRPQIQAFLNLTSQLKSKPTPLGDILLTDPSDLPFDMDMVLIPDGDYDKWIKQAYVNINLRRANCTGRSSLNLRPPNPASEEKFRSLYKIADTVKFDEAVINLVCLVQLSLYFFKLLDKDYIDGLICDQTTAALWTFYTKYDPIKTTEFTLKEPWMEPHLLAAIISKLLMCRNKLHDQNFTAVKDPFSDPDTFRVHVGDYQRYKNIRVTKYIDLETLHKLNEHNFSQLKVRKVIKSKLDDISGITNSPLFNETSDPEVFRHHATIESLRAIWRPRLRGVSSNSMSNGSDQNVMHMIKGVSRSGGAALSRVAGSIPWISTDSNKKQQQQVQSPLSLSPTTTASRGENHLDSYISALDETSRISSNQPSRRPSPLTVHTSASSIDESDSDMNGSPGQQQPMSPDHLDQDIPSYVQSAPHTSSTTPSTPVTSAGTATATPPLPPPHSRLRVSKSSDTNHQQFIQKEQGDFVPFIQRKKNPRHSRSVSDSILLDPLFAETLIDKAKTTDNLKAATFKKYQPMTVPLTHKRSFTTSTIPQVIHEQRPMATMDVQTYMTYEKLVQQQRMLQQTYEEMKHMADMYEKTANTLKETYEKRSKEFDIIQRESRTVLDEQIVTERRLKDVEDNSAKLHYELKVLNDKLKDIEDNVGTFYGKVGLLERKMDDSQQSITTMIIIGKYLNHYWVKVREWIDWFGGDKKSPLSSNEQDQQKSK